MKLRTKKNIAREFLLLTIVLILGFICFVCTYPYNLYRNSQISSLDKAIDEKTVLTDRLSNSYKIKLQKRSWFYEKCTAKFGADIYQREDLWNRLDYLAKQDSIKIKWNLWDKELLAFTKELDFTTPEKFKDFFDVNRINITDTNNFNQSLKINQEIITLKTKKREIETKILPFQKQVDFGIKSVIVFGIILFALRYLLYAIRWSIKVLKQKNE